MPKKSDRSMSPVVENSEAARNAGTPYYRPLVSPWPTRILQPSVQHDPGIVIDGPPRDEGEIDAPPPAVVVPPRAEVAHEVPYNPQEFYDKWGYQSGPATQSPSTYYEDLGDGYWEDMATGQVIRVAPENTKELKMPTKPVTPAKS